MPGCSPLSSGRGTDEASTVAGVLEAGNARGVTGHEQASAAETDEAGIHAGVLSALQWEQQGTDEALRVAGALETVQA